MAAMIPLLFFVTDVLRERRRLVDVLAVAAVVAAMLLQGYPPLLLVTLYALAGFLVVRWWESTSAEARASIGSRIRAGLKPAVLIVAAFALGAALTAFQMVPLTRGLDEYDLSYRASNSVRFLPAASLLTTAFPWAQGSTAEPESLRVLNPEVRLYSVNFVEQFAFLGAAAVVLALWAALAGRPSGVGRGTYRYFLIGTAILLLVLFGRSVGPLPDLGGAITDALYAVPGVRQVPVMRFTALLLFLATPIAAFGIQHVAGAQRSALRFDRRFLLRAGALLVFLAYLSYRAVRQELTLLLDRTSTDFWGSTFIHVASQRSWILRHAAIPALIAVATVVVIVLARRNRGRWRTAALYTLPVLLAVEGLMVAGPMLPRIDESDYYPDTGVTRFLQNELGHDRVAMGGREMLYYAANPEYGIRSVAGHAFTPRTWRDLLSGTRPEYQIMLQTRLAQSSTAARHPILDRLGARYWAAVPESPPFGAIDDAPVASGAVRLGAGETVSGPVGAGPVRAVGVGVLGRVRLNGDLVFLDVALRDSSGRVVARGRRRLRDQDHALPYFVYFGRGERIAPTTTLQAEVTLRSARPDRVRLAANTDGDVRLIAVRPADDGLRVAYADAGGTIYERLDALPRIRWVSRADVKGAPLTYLAIRDGQARDEVLLAQRGPAVDGKPADLEVVEDEPDKIRIDVAAQGAGYVVVADAIQSGWQARLDGERTKLRKADHALVAVHVPEGSHTIELVARPSGWRLGILVSLTALVGVLCLLGVVLIRRRRGARDASKKSSIAVPDDGLRSRQQAPDEIVSSQS
jgi:hypothetical protein